MNGFLLDTNVIAETTKHAPDPQVLAFLADRQDFWLSPIVLHELEFGLRLLPPGRRRERLGTALSQFIALYEDRVLPIDRDAAEWAARLRATARRVGRTLDLGDGLIAGTARGRDLAIATRNVADFEDLGVAVVNPWQPTRLPR